MNFIPNRVYVDSGSTDDSVAAAVREGYSVIELDAPPKYTAARARNAGLQRLLEAKPDLEFVQMVDGDCEMLREWIPGGLAALRAKVDVAALFGRLHERHPTRSVYNAICDDDWNVPVGETAIVGGIAMFRVAALRQANFYNPSMIAGEDPDLSMRMRNHGWRLRRIDVPMGFHDVNIMRFGQWWKRERRTGHAYGELAYRHPDARNPNWARTNLSIMFWGGGTPVILLAVTLLAVCASPLWALPATLVPLVWSVRILQIARRRRARGLTWKIALAAGAGAMLGKIPQLLGLFEYHRNRVIGRASQIIEHKNPSEVQ